ncbi:hypothetical protein [uncultured Thiodictyon sp.]|uniref:hypothetical protein n=1 Tax=uncultured Thiodictyon sp. TaxID=1846217 RepID=UPI0025FDD815|nr:hypothetical protein [uncultured Thiodictyon sp.]
MRLNDRLKALEAADPPEDNRPASEMTLAELRDRLRRSFVARGLCSADATDAEIMEIGRQFKVNHDATE